MPSSLFGFDTVNARNIPHAGFRIRLEVELPRLSGNILFSRISLASVPSSIKSSLVITPKVRAPAKRHGTNVLATLHVPTNSITIQVAVGNFGAIVSAAAETHGLTHSVKHFGNRRGSSNKRTRPSGALTSAQKAQEQASVDTRSVACNCLIEISGLRLKQRCSHGQ